MGVAFYRWMVHQYQCTLRLHEYDHITFIIVIEVPHCKLTLLILHIPLLYIEVHQYMISMLMYIKILHLHMEVSQVMGLPQTMDGLFHGKSSIEMDDN